MMKLLQAKPCTLMLLLFMFHSAILSFLVTVSKSCLHYLFFMLLDFSSRCYLRDGIQPPRLTQSSSSVTLLRPTAQSHLKITNHYFTQHLSCAINCLRVSCVHHFTMRQVCLRVSCVHHFTMRQVDCKCGHCSPLFPCYVILVLQSTCLMMFNWPTCPVLLQVRPVSNSELTDIVGAECPADTASGQ